MAAFCPFPYSSPNSKATPFVLLPEFFLFSTFSFFCLPSFQVVTFHDHQHKMTGKRMSESTAVPSLRAPAHRASQSMRRCASLPAADPGDWLCLCLGCCCVNEKIERDTGSSPRSVSCSSSDVNFLNMEAGLSWIVPTCICSLLQLWLSKAWTESANLADIFGIASKPKPDPCVAESIYSDASALSLCIHLYAPSYGWRRFVLLYVIELNIWLDRHANICVFIPIYIYIFKWMVFICAYIKLWV